MFNWVSLLSRCLKYLDHRCSFLPTVASFPFTQLCLFTFFGRLKTIIFVRCRTDPPDFGFLFVS